MRWRVALGHVFMAGVYGVSGSSLLLFLFLFLLVCFFLLFRWEGLPRPTDSATHQSRKQPTQPCNVRTNQTTTWPNAKLSPSATNQSANLWTVIPHDDSEIWSTLTRAVTGAARMVAKRRSAAVEASTEGSFVFLIPERNSRMPGLIDMRKQTSPEVAKCESTHLSSRALDKPHASTTTHNT